MTHAPARGLAQPTFFVDTPTTRLPLGRGGTAEQQVFVDSPTTSVFERPVSDEVRDCTLPVEWARRYTVRERLGVSGQAALWIADAADGTPVVVRRAFQQTIREPHRLTLAQLAALRHPQIVQAIEEPLEREPYRWELLEYCSQRSVATLQRPGRTAEEPRRPLSLEFIRTVVAAIAEALRYLHHDLQVLHTDLKPDNMLVRGDGSVVLGDFSSAINRLHVPVGSDSGRTPQYTPVDDWFSEHWDWAQLGLSTLTMAIGIENPAHRYHEVDYDALDPAISRLVRGLLVREAHLRWGYTDVVRWLRGEDVPIRGTDPAQRHRDRGFLVHVDGQPCESPEDLGDLLSRRWTEAVRFIQGPSPTPASKSEVSDSESWLRWLARQLERTGDDRATEVGRIAQLRIGGASEQAVGGRVTSPEHALAQLVTCLNPRGIPRYGVSPGRAVPLTASDLAQISYEAARADNADHEAVKFVQKLFDGRMLTAFRGMEGYAWLARLDDSWHTAHDEVTRHLGRAAKGAARSRRDYQRRLRDAGLPEEQALEFGEADWERHQRGDRSTFSTLVAAHLLRGLVDPDFEETILLRAREAGESEAAEEPWFAALVSGRRGDALDDAAGTPPAGRRPLPAHGRPRGNVHAMWERFRSMLARILRRG